MVIQLHENDLDGQFLFGQDSRIILTKKLVDRPGLAGQRLPRAGSGHRGARLAGQRHQQYRQWRLLHWGKVSFGDILSPSERTGPAIHPWCPPGDSMPAAAYSPCIHVVM